MVSNAYYTKLNLQICNYAQNDAFVAIIVNTRLTIIFMAIFAPDERLPSSATLITILTEMNNITIFFSPIMLPDMKKRTFCGSMPGIFIRELFGRFLLNQVWNNSEMNPTVFVDSWIQQNSHYKLCHACLDQLWHNWTLYQWHWWFESCVMIQIGRTISKLNIRSKSLIKSLNICIQYQAKDIYRHDWSRLELNYHSY